MIDEFGFENSKIRSLEDIEQNTRKLEDKIEQLIVTNQAILQEIRSRKKAMESYRAIVIVLLAAMLVNLVN